MITFYMYLLPFVTKQLNPTLTELQETHRGSFIALRIYRSKSAAEKDANNRYFAYIFCSILLFFYLLWRKLMLYQYTEGIDTHNWYRPFIAPFLSSFRLYWLALLLVVRLTEMKGKYLETRSGVAIKTVICYSRQPKW